MIRRMTVIGCGGTVRRAELCGDVGEVCRIGGICPYSTAFGGTGYRTQGTGCGGWGLGYVPYTLYPKP